MDHHRALRINTSSAEFWKVTLGFLPFYVNLNKRLYDETGLECARQKEALAMKRATEEAEGVDQKSIAPTESIEVMIIHRDIEGMHVLSEASSSGSPPAPEVEWSDISESSTGGWSDSDTEDDVATKDSRNSAYYSIPSYSGSEWKFAWPQGDETEESTTNSNDVVSRGSSLSYSSAGSGSSYYSARSSEYMYSKWRKDGDASDLGWMEQVSRAVFGEI